MLDEDDSSSLKRSKRSTDLLSLDNDSNQSFTSYDSSNESSCGDEDSDYSFCYDELEEDGYSGSVDLIEHAINISLNSISLDFSTSQNEDSIEETYNNNSTKRKVNSK
eukprot:scaffold3873_cov177-Ochromonas_danica.AAC.8